MLFYKNPQVFIIAFALFVRLTAATDAAPAYLVMLTKCQILVSHSFHISTDIYLLLFMVAIIADHKAKFGTRTHDLLTQFDSFSPIAL